MLVFQRADCTVEVEAITWAMIVEFFAEAGWQPNVPTHRLVTSNSVTVDEESAAALAAAGNVVLEETMTDPMSAYSQIQFDMGKFAEIIEFSEGGEFTVTQRH